jgi:phosphoribosylglycinamide formyltransferase-1
MKSLIIFASGKGSNAEAIIQYFKKTQQAKVSLIVCNKVDAGVLDIARNHNIPFIIINKQTIGEALLVTQMQEYNPDLVVLAGFLWKIPNSLLVAFSNKIINIHPALLPKYGGKGMYGHFVHEAVYSAKEKETGITIHYVNEQYDEGAHIMQAHCKLSSEDKPDVIAQKISRLEHTFFPKTIEYLLNEQ